MEVVGLTSSACHAYAFFIRASSFKRSNHRKWNGTKIVIKWIRAFEFEFSIKSSVYSATTVAKVSLFSTWTKCSVSFYSIKAQKLTRLVVTKHRQFSTQTNSLLRPSKCLYDYWDLL